MRRPDPSLADLLYDEPQRFDFFQAIRLLERIAAGRAPVGHDVIPAREVVRLVSLFYRAWEKYNVPALYERGGPGGSGRDRRDAFSSRLFDLVGLGLESLRDRQAVPDRSLPFYAGLFAQQHRSAVALELLIR